jgi:hypothetical protein
MSKGQGWSYETCWIVATYEYSCLEMGRHQHEFYCGPAHKFNSIWVIIDRLTKSTHFTMVHTYYRAEKYAELYIARILCLHGVPKTIFSDRGPQLLLISSSSCMDFLGNASDP